MRYLTFLERIRIETLVKVHTPVKEIAAQLGRCLSTIYKELKRGEVTQLDTYLREYTTYSADVAQQKHDYAQTSKGRPLKLGKDHAFAAYIEHLIKTERYSPAGVELTEYLVKNGDIVHEGDPVARVDRISVMSAITEVQERINELDGVVTVTMTDDGPAVDEHVRVSDEDGRLLGEGEITVNEPDTAEDVLTIPAAALNDDGTRSFVYTGYDADKGVLMAPVYVTCGLSDGDPMCIWCYGLEP